ncbi:transmembrane protein 60 isoform X2 [Lycorma delicatula]|uniref:transmembrane protein 60 isoform X2 n=1 Tax=Lycorma delicatula TaxID=130591 RepID=UPI003F5162A7
MAVLHRALFTWFVLLVFLILIVLRLDSRTNWNWFIVFIPLWVYDSILLIYVFFNMMSHWKNGHDRLSNSVQRKIWYLFAIILKLASQIMLCLKLQNPSIHVSTYYVLTPLWILLPLLIIDVFFTLVRGNNNR